MLLTFGCNADSTYHVSADYVAAPTSWAVIRNMQAYATNVLDALTAATAAEHLPPPADSGARD
jgi:hypothetical protein